MSTLEVIFDGATLQFDPEIERPVIVPLLDSALDEDFVEVSLDDLCFASAGERDRSAPHLKSYSNSR